MKNRTCQGEERTERLEIQSLIGKQKERTTSMASGAERYEGMGGVVAAELKLQSSVSPRATASQGRTGRASGDGRRILGQRSDRASREKLQRQLGKAR